MGYGTIYKRNCIECHRPFESTVDIDTCISCMLRPSRIIYRTDHKNNGFSKEIAQAKRNIEKAKAEAMETGKPVIVATQKIDYIKEHDTYKVTNEVRDLQTLSIKKTRRKYIFKIKPCNKCLQVFIPTSGAQKNCSDCKGK